MNSPVIVAGRRTPIGTAGHGLRRVDVDHLAANVLQATIDDLVERTGLRSDELLAEVGDVIVGNVMGPGGNIARLAALRSGFGAEVTGVTVDRQCGSGLEAINLAAAQIRAGCGSIYLAGGAESASTAPWRMARPKRPDGLPQPYERAPFSPAHVGDPDMGVAAETVAREHGISRERQDRYAARSHARAVAAQVAGRFSSEISVVAGLENDERPRAKLTEATLRRFPAAFVANGTVTAGNSCGISDGAAVVAVVSDAWRARHGLPGLHVRAWKAVGVDPNRCGIAIVPAVRQLLADTNTPLADIDLFEFTEAFAGQTLSCIDELGIDEAKVCPDGGAIALGHPWGATAAVLVVRLFTQMIHHRGPRLGIAACAIGGGLGLATLFERTD